MQFVRLPSGEDQQDRRQSKSKHCWLSALKWAAVCLILGVAVSLVLRMRMDSPDLQMFGSYRQATIELDEQRQSLRSAAQLATPTPIESALMGRLPQILWVVIDSEPSGMPILQQMILNNLRSFGEASSFNVQILTVEEAYQYLSPQITSLLTETLQTRRIDIDLSEILRLALLLEHGGVSIRLNQTILTEPLQWLDSLFNKDSLSPLPAWMCLPAESEVSLFWNSEQNRYSDFLLAATAGSSFLWGCWELIESVLWFGRWPYPIEPAERYIERTNVYRIDNLLQSVVNVKLKAGRALNYYHQYHQREDKYDAQLQPICQTPVALIDISQITATYSQPQCSFINYRFAHSSKEDFTTQCGSPQYLIHSLITHFNQEIETAVNSESIAHIHPNSLLAQFLNSPLNAALWNPLPTKRHPHFCIIGPHPVELADSAALKIIRSYFNALQRQNYANWTAFYFIKSNMAQEMLADIFWQGDQPSQLSDKVQFILSSDEIEAGVRSANLQVAVANYCPKHSIVVILEALEKFTEDTALQKLADEFTSVSVFAAMISLQLKEELLQPSPLSQQHCLKYHIDQSEKQLILNHLRLFDSDLYKLVPAFELKSLQGHHHSLLPVQLNMLHYACPYPLPSQYTHLYHSFRTKMAFPQTLVRLIHITILTNDYLEPTLKELKLLEHKPKAHSLNQSFAIMGKYGFPASKILVFNEARKDLEKRGGQKGEQGKESAKEAKIPKIIHQVWMGGEMPAVRKELQQRNLKLHPDYSYYLWTYDDITATAFPLTHRIIHNLISFDPVSPYSKMAMVADLVRFEALYRHGGFYYDINIELFAPLDPYRYYSFMTSTEIAPTHRVSLSLALFAVPPNYPPLLRLLSTPALNSLKLFDRFTNYVTGPYFFSRLLEGAEMREDVLLLPFESVYPFRNWYNQDLCEVKRELWWWESESSNLGRKEEEVHRLRENCSNYYPHAVAIDHFTFGASWLTRRNTVATWKND